MGRANSTGNGRFPTYECAMNKSIIDPFGMRTFQHSVGIGDEDTVNGLNACWTAVGAFYAGEKVNPSSNPWDNPLHYPTFLLQSAGPAVETKKGLEEKFSLGILPNPFYSSTSISYNLVPNRTGTMEIFGL
jgi:hypothetical protein